MWQIAIEGAMPRFWPPRPNPLWSATLTPLRRYALEGYLRIADVNVQNWQNVAGRIGPNDGVLFAPNHSHDSDPLVMMAVARKYREQFYFMAAWQLFEKRRGLDGFIMQRLGAFSVDREGCDRRAVKQAVEILASGRKLVVFPEGDVYHLNERLTPLLEGVAFMALTAQRELEKSHSPGRVWIVPTAIRYFYVENIEAALSERLRALEQRFLITPPAGATLLQRVTFLGEILVTMKEKEKLGHSRESEGNLAARLSHFVESLLSRLEQKWTKTSPSADTVSARIKAIRRVLLEKYTNKESDDATRVSAREGLQEVQLAVQLWSYPGNYLAEKFCQERLAETLSQLEEDTSGHPLRPAGKRKANVIFGEPIDLKEKMSASHRMRDTATAVTDELEDKIREQMKVTRPTS